MSDPTERVIGALQQFKEHADARLDKLEQKVDALQQFKWRVAGGAGVLSVLLAIAIEAVKTVLRRG